MLKRNITSLILISILLFFFFFLRRYCIYSVDIIIMFFLVMGGVEMYDSLKKSEKNPFLIPIISYMVIIYPLYFFYQELGMIIAVAISSIIALSNYVLKRDNHQLTDLFYTLGILIYPMFFVTLFFAINDYAGNLLGMLMILVISLFTDTFALFVGKIFGKHKLCPTISPNKTIEGAIGGFFGAMLGAAIIFLLFDYFHLFDNIPLIGRVALWENNIVISIGLYVAFAIVIYFTTTIGDLTASWIKRNLEIKDFGKIFPGHGGVMDRLDSLIFTVPAVYLFFMLLQTTPAFPVQ